MRNSKLFQLRFWLSIRTFRRMRKTRHHCADCQVVYHFCWTCFWFSPCPTCPFNFFRLDICLAQIRIPISHLFPVMCPVEKRTMENSHGREIHYHLARALMHMNYIAGFLPFEPSVDWDDQPQDPYGRTTRAHPHPRHLHTFVPLPSSSSVPTLASHSGIPSHMVLNPEPNLRPLSIRRQGNLSSDHHQGSKAQLSWHIGSGACQHIKFL